MSEEKNKNFSSIYIQNEDGKLLELKKIDSLGNTISNICIDEFYSNKEFNFKYTNKAFIKMNQVKSKRLKKKYYKKTIIYRIRNII